MSILLGEPLVPLLAYTIVRAVVDATEIIRYIESGLTKKYHVSLKKNLCNKVFVIQNFMEIWYINLRKSFVIQTSLIF